MDKYFIIFVMVSLMVYTTTARSYHNCNHHKYGQAHHEPHHGHGHDYSDDSDEFDYSSEGDWDWSPEESGENNKDHKHGQVSAHNWNDGKWIPDSEEMDYGSDENDDDGEVLASHKPWFSWKPTTRPTRTQTSKSLTSTTPSPTSIESCMRTCPVTPEYNPVCGSNNVTYNNPGKLECARRCGADVTLQRQSPCPAPLRLNNYAPSEQFATDATTPNIIRTSPNPQTMDLNPVRDTPESSSSTTSNNSNEEIVPIPNYILDAIFRKPSTEEDIPDIDVRIGDS